MPDPLHVAGHDEETGVLPPPDFARLSVRQKRESLMQTARIRTLSDGSTLEAFVPGDAPAPVRVSHFRRRRSSRRPRDSAVVVVGRPSHQFVRQLPIVAKPPTASGTVSDLGEIASMALEGLGDDDVGQLVGGVSPKPQPPRRIPTGPTFAGQRRQRLAGAHPSTKRSGSQRLSTIVDDAERPSVVSPPPLGGMLLPKNSMIMDSLRFSEVTVDFQNDMAAALSQTGRDRGMFLSERGDVGLSLRNSNRASSALLGASILEGQVAQGDYGAFQPAEHQHPLKSNSKDSAVHGNQEDDWYIDQEDERDSSFLGLLDPTDWLIRDLKFDRQGLPFFEESAGWTVAGFVRYLLFNPLAPEFTSIQNFCWAVLLGVFMGFYTACWKEIIEHSVDIMWKDLPEALLEWGFFTPIDGSFPLYHWMWICPAFWGGFLSYIFAVLPTPIPGQNEWITAVHTQGVQDSETFFLLFVLSTLGMASGLSLGPELPLVLTSGMIGSWLGILCKQSVLQARVMNITAAGAAVAGFFGFPMAGALFVMEVPHRMGLQYFEALSPATISSIVAVLCNRLTTGNDVTGYYSYPFLSPSLPSGIFSSAIIYGIFGTWVGVFYATTVLKVKGLVHDFFHATHDHHDDKEHTKEQPEQEKTPLILKGKLAGEECKSAPTNSEPPLHQKMMKMANKILCCVIPYEPHRALAAGVIAGAMAGGIGIFFPQVMFWGEAQLQSMIDRGRTPLPIFGRDNDPTAALTARAFCMIDSKDPEAVKAGFGMGCALLISLAKIIVTGLSVGTGIVGGHFWGPLFTGCLASHFLVDAAKVLDEKTGFGGSLAAYPCVAILCVMGSAHVVTFRAHMAIMLILTLTISAFNPEDPTNGGAAVAGDYSAVFPLLVVSVFVSLMLSRHTVFYKAQQSRVDISARPEVLCQPGQVGMPVVEQHYGGDDDYDENGSYLGDVEGYAFEAEAALEQKPSLHDEITQSDIENEFSAKVEVMIKAPASELPLSRSINPLPPRPRSASGELKSGRGNDTLALSEMASSRLDELLSIPMDNSPVVKQKHRRIQSAPDVDFVKKSQGDRPRSTGEGPGGHHVRTDSYGKAIRVATIGSLSLEHPSLMDQARLRSATTVLVESRHGVEARHVRNPSVPTTSGGRGNNQMRQHVSSSSGHTSSPGGPGATLSSSEVERAFTSAVNQQLAGGSKRTGG